MTETTGLLTTATSGWGKITRTLSPLLPINKNIITMSISKVSVHDRYGSCTGPHWERFSSDTAYTEQVPFWLKNGLVMPISQDLSNSIARMCPIVGAHTQTNIMTCNASFSVPPSAYTSAHPQLLLIEWVLKQRYHIEQQQHQSLQKSHNEMSLILVQSMHDSISQVNFVDPRKQP